jgi:hypothetical protein
VPFEVYILAAIGDGETLSGLLLAGGSGGGDVAGLDGYSGDVSPGDICCNSK